MEAPICLRCETAMVAGDLVAHGVKTFWAEVREPWLGPIMQDYKKLLGIRAFRCPKCGYVESYAIE